MSAIFEKASRAKLRFDSPKGFLAVEDLWDLPLTSTTGKACLDAVAIGLHRELKDKEEVSFVTKGEKSDEILQLKFDVVKHIIDTRIAENEAAARLRENREKLQKLLAVRAQRSDQQLASMTDEELAAEQARLLALM